MGVTSPEVAQARSGKSALGRARLAGQSRGAGRRSCRYTGSRCRGERGCELALQQSVLGKARDRNKTLLVCPGSRVWHPGEGMNTCA